MKIALLSEKYTPDIGGLAISTERLARLLESAGHNVRVFCPSLSLSPSEQRTITHNGIDVRRFGAHKRVDDTLVDWFELLTQEHKREPFDVLQAYFLTQAGFIAAYAGNYFDVPSIVSARGNDLERAIFEPSRAAHVLYALDHANVITANADELVKKAQALIPGLEVTVIPNGINTEHFRPIPCNDVLAASLGLIDEGKMKEERLPVIGFVGELRAKKGLRTLLSAYAQVSKSKPAILLIIGDIRAGDEQDDPYHRGERVQRVGESPTKSGEPTLEWHHHERACHGGGSLRCILEALSQLLQPLRVGVLQACDGPIPPAGRYPRHQVEPCDVVLVDPRLALVAAAVVTAVRGVFQ